MEIRVGNKKDMEFIEEMLFEAFHWNSNMSRPDRNEFFKNQEFQKLISNWGRYGDRMIIADYEGKSVGAAWFRLWNESDNSYGYVNSSIPELGMGVRQEYRSQSIGRALLKELVHRAVQDGFDALSLSVDPSNFARKLYESEGFIKVGESGTSWTYLLNL